MPKLPETPTATYLSRAYAGEELEMQSIELEWQGQKHGLRLMLRQGKRTAQIKIWLTENHHLILRPVDRGAAGYAKWMSFTAPIEASKVPPYLIRAWVEIFDRKVSLKEAERKSESFTIQGDALKAVVIGSLDQYLKLTGKLLMPLFLGAK